jgi:hypothetical protein
MGRPDLPIAGPLVVFHLGKRAARCLLGETRLMPQAEDKVMDLKLVIRALPAHYGARFVAAEDSSVDDEIQILLHGVQVPWSIQCLSDGGYSVNEYGFHNGEIAWAKHYGLHCTLGAAAARLAKEINRR